MYVHECLDMLPHIHTCIYTHTHKHTCMHTCHAYTHTLPHAHTHTLTHSHSHTHTHTHTLVSCIVQSEKKCCMCGYDKLAEDGSQLTSSRLGMTSNRTSSTVPSSALTVSTLDKHITQHQHTSVSAHPTAHSFHHKQ